MAKDFTQRLHRIAKRSGMFDFAKVQSFSKTRKLIKKYIPLIDDYFRSKEIPIKIICGDAFSIKKCIELCPSLTETEICLSDEVMNKDFSVIKNGTILIARDEMEETYRLEAEIYNLSLDCRVCSIYEYLELQKVNARCSFWNYYSFSWNLQSLKGYIRSLFLHFVSYEKINLFLNDFIRKFHKNSNIQIYLPSYLTNEKIFCAQQSLRAEKWLDKDEKRMQLKKLMGYHVIFKDIIGLKKLICQYAKEYDNSFIQYNSFIDEIISDMKEKIAKRKSKDILINWMDAVSNNRLKEELPFLYSLSTERSSIKSEYAYTCMPWTTPTLKTIMTGKYPIEGRLYDYKFLEDDMELIKQMETHEYRFKYFGHPFFSVKIIPKRYKGKREKTIRSSVSTEYMWNALNYLSMTKDTPQTILIHQLFETHEPYFCPEIEKEMEIDKKKLLSSAWIDRQWKFYIEIMGDKSVQIYIGDHGIEPYAYLNNRLNVAFFVRNAIKRIDFSKGMFSFKNFPQLIYYIMDWEMDCKEQEVMTDYVISESFDYYNKGNVERILQDVDALSDKRKWMQVRSIRTKEFVYVLLFDGEEMFFKLPDENKNLIDEPEYREKIKEMRENLGKEFVDIYQEDFFVHSRKLYEAYEKLKKYD